MSYIGALVLMGRWTSRGGSGSFIGVDYIVGYIAAISFVAKIVSYIRIGQGRGDGGELHH